MISPSPPRSRKIASIFCSTFRGIRPATAFLSSPDAPRRSSSDGPGYVGTVGLDTYDGIIADPVEIPPQDDPFYVEPVIRLPDCYVCYHPPTDPPPVAPLPAASRGRFTFGCFNRPAKLNEEVGKAWARILEEAAEFAHLDGLWRP